MRRELTYADVVAGVSAAVAAYCQAVDDGRTDDVVALYCPDGSCDIPGLGAHEGHEALRAGYAKVEPRVPQRHVISNLHVTGWSQDQATASCDFVFMVRGEAGWSTMLVGRYQDTLHRAGDRWLFHRREAEFLR
jgi:hypothetical protein